MPAGLNLAEALLGTGQQAEASAVAQRTLTLVEGSSSLSAEVLEAGHFPPAYDHFRVEWERAAWSNPGNAAEARAKQGLLRWRLHGLLADLTGHLAHYEQAQEARSDLPSTRAALGCALARAGRLLDALPHLRVAVAGNPFDLRAARALYQALGDAGETEEQQRVAQERRWLAQAAPEMVPLESWFADRPRSARGLASILILCCNELDCTRLCLESVLRHTRPPYELVLVDIGSTDGTPAYLEEIRARPGPVRVEVIRNATNRGFPAGCNQALAQARGDYLVLLNNDTVVTESWLDGLIAWSRHQEPSVGLVGAVTNRSRPPQQIEVSYRALDGLDAFAARRRREYAGKALEVERLTGFCLLLRREVVARLGGLDESFGLGFFDDDDLSVRARRAGFRLLVALDVFVHHFGTRTFTHCGIDCTEQLQRNFERFQAKWGPEESAGYQLPAGPGGTPPAPVVSSNPAPARRGRVSACLIVRNEEANLPDCLNTIRDLVDEVHVTDTGSTDRTREVASALGARVFEFPWCDSFAAARNASMRQATGDWIFWFDADDRLDQENRQKLAALFAGLREENAAYAMTCLCVPDLQSSQSGTAVTHVRLFRNHPRLQWRYRVHEQILLSVRQLGGDVRWTDIVIHHLGYQDSRLRQHKLERDLRLLCLENADNPDDPFTLFNLGCVYRELGQPSEALRALQRSLERSNPRDSIVRKLYALIVQCQRQLGRSAEALAACQAGRDLYPEDAELLFQEALVRREVGDRGGAITVLQRLLATREQPHFASLDTGICGYKARHNLALWQREEGALAEAETHWRAVVAERSDFLPAWLGLGEVYLAQQRWPALEETLQQLGRLPDATAETPVLQARGHLARREFGRARVILEDAIGRHQRAVAPRVLLSHVLLQEGQDWEAAERALRDVLLLDPNHAEARNNLSLLRLRRARAAGV